MAQSFAVSALFCSLQHNQELVPTTASTDEHLWYTVGEMALILHASFFTVSKCRALQLSDHNAVLMWRLMCRGDYFVATCPGGASQSVVVHQLSKHNSQRPFRKNKGKITTCAFHPSQPLLLVASETNVKVYNLVKQALTKTLLAGGGVITALHIHPSGDHVLVGTEDKRCLWCAASFCTIELVCAHGCHDIVLWDAPSG